jgi:peptide/nickel transport system permease protein
MILLRTLGLRGLEIVLTLLAIATINFVLVHAAPGDPATVMAGQSGAADEVFLAQIRRDYGLDEPFLVQLATYLGKVVQLDLGYSFRQQRDVIDLILERTGPTLLLTLSAFLIALLGGIFFGAVAGRRHGTWSDTAISLAALVFYATPVFWLGLMLVLVFSIQLAWLPAFGFSSIRAVSMSPVDYALDVAAHLVLPAVTLATIYMAVYTRLMRASVIEVAQEDFVKTARAKGLSEGEIMRRHILRNSSIPIVTFAGLQIGAMFGGAVVVETVFSWPGLGRLTFDAVTQRDYPVLLGLFVVMALLVMVVNALTDVVYRLIDPRMGAR